MSVGEYVILISSVSAALVAVVNAVAGGWGRQAANAARVEAKASAATTTQKLDEIHTLTNGNLTDLKAQLDTALDQINRLEAILVSAGVSVPPTPKG